MLIHQIFTFVFQLKLKKSDNTSDIDADLVTVNNFFAHWIKEIGITKYGSDKELPPTFSPWEGYQYSDQMLKYLPSDSLKTIQKSHLLSKKPVYFASETYERRNHNGGSLNTTGLSTKNCMLKT